MQFYSFGRWLTPLLTVNYSAQREKEKNRGESVVHWKL
jgi:hypothetical protein